MIIILIARKHIFKLHPAFSFTLLLSSYPNLSFVLFSGVFPKQDSSSSAGVDTQPPVPHQPTQQQTQQPQQTLPINIPGAKPTHQYPIVPIVSHSPQTPPRQGHPGLVAGSHLIAPSSFAASTSGSSLTSDSSVASSGSPVANQLHGQPQMPIDPRTPPRPTPGGSQPSVTSLVGPRGPQQTPPLAQQFRMPGASPTVLRGPPIVNRAPLPPGLVAGPTYTQALHTWCWQHGVPQPQFEFFGNQKTGTIRASVQLPNGLKIMGPDGVNQPAAADMASHILLNKLVSLSSLCYYSDDGKGVFWVLNT